MSESKMTVYQGMFVDSRCGSCHAKVRFVFLEDEHIPFLIHMWLEAKRHTLKLFAKQQQRT